MLSKADLDEKRRRRQVAVQVTTGQTRVIFGTWQQVMAGVLLDHLRLIHEVERLTGMVRDYARTTMPFEEFVRMTMGEDEYKMVMGGGRTAEALKDGGECTEADAAPINTTE